MKGLRSGLRFCLWPLPFSGLLDPSIFLSLLLPFVILGVASLAAGGLPLPAAALGVLALLSLASGLFFSLLALQLLSLWPLLPAFFFLSISFEPLPFLLFSAISLLPRLSFGVTGDLLLPRPALVERDRRPGSSFGRLLACVADVLLLPPRGSNDVIPQVHCGRELERSSIAFSTALASKGEASPSAMPH